MKTPFPRRYRQFLRQVLNLQNSQFTPQHLALAVRYNPQTRNSRSNTLLSQCDEIFNNRSFVIALFIHSAEPAVHAATPGSRSAMRSSITVLSLFIHSIEPAVHAAIPGSRSAMRSSITVISLLRYLFILLNPQFTQ
jgi:hypothetical protein